MAVIDLTTLNWSNGGAMKKVTGISTLLQEINIPKWCKLVTVKPESQAIVFSYDGTDASSKTGNEFPHPVDAIIQYNPQQTAEQRSIFVASQSGTAQIYFIFE
tara:strand:+ start:123 stop:431 length:309 start_codon:yes stop_codon:yes gene_type:complete